ncbi:hypothetical protein I4U23_016911 [Adineta vaga]|nr:hypothetical protein I4U23_016911 [Adineta vaga]
MIQRFLGNVFTYLQPELRSNTCCIYSLCGSFIDVMHFLFNFLINYLSAMYGIYIPWIRLPSLCKIQIFILGLLPHLSINFLLMSVIDSYASTCSLTSPIRRINQLKMFPWFIGITIFTSCLASTRGLILFEYVNTVGCVQTHPLINNILYIVLNGFMQPIAMFMFVVLTFRNVQQSRKRAGGLRANVRRTRNQFIKMIFTQILATAFISLQWMIMYLLWTVFFNSAPNSEQRYIIYFFYTLTNRFYYLNNVKSFYVSLLTSHLFRRTFIKALIVLLLCHLQHR